MDFRGLIAAACRGIGVWAERYQPCYPCQAFRRNCGVGLTRSLELGILEREKYSVSKFNGDLLSVHMIVEPPFRYKNDMIAMAESYSYSHGK